MNFIAFQFDDDFNNQDDEYVSETSDYPSASDSEKHNDGNAVAVKDDSKVTVCFNLNAACDGFSGVHFVLKGTSTI